MVTRNRIGFKTGTIYSDTNSQKVWPLHPVKNIFKAKKTYLFFSDRDNRQDSARLKSKYLFRVWTTKHLKK